MGNDISCKFISIIDVCYVISLSAERWAFNICFVVISDANFKFLYGCAVNAFILRVNWLTGSVAAGFILPKKKYVTCHIFDWLAFSRLCLFLFVPFES